MRIVAFSFVALAWVALAPRAFAQAGNDNPGGVTAEYHGSITTAGYYDAYTGNAKREITDIVVSGSIGAYPLRYTRTYDTRGMNGWTNNYLWVLAFYNPDTNDCTDIRYCGPIGHVTYPGGSSLDLWEPTDPGIWLLSGVNGRNGPVDRLVKCSTANSGCEAGAVYEIRRADGGKVFFQPGATANSYLAYAIDDPYGQRTTLEYSGDSLVRVTEPGGRYLQLNYQTYSYLERDGTWVSAGLLGSVQAYAAPGILIESVSYGYEGVWNTTGYLAVHAYYLTKAYYDDGTEATYTYEASNMNTGGNMGFQTYLNVLHTCDDPRYAGPMKFIEYDYVQSSEAPTYVGQGQIKAEKNISGQVVSQTTYPTSENDPNLYRRTETRGDGPSRTFYYANGLKWTDFQNHPFSETGSSSGGGWRVTDARGNATDYECEPVLDALRKITFPQTGPNQPPATREYTFSDPSNPCYHSGEKDENGYWTTFERDEKNRVTKITYPDTSTEEFTYNGFGQVLTHKLRSGGAETFTYDGRGLKQTSYPPATENDPDPWNHPTRYYYYESGPNTDRLYQVNDPFGNATRYEYNQRGQVTKVTHPDGTYTQSAYNNDGTLAWTADENHPNAWMDGHDTERTRYEYDAYKRVTAVRKPGETLPMTNYYGLDWANPLLHTTNCVKYTLSPMNKSVVYEYDENLRKTYQGVALGSNDAAESRFQYDKVGNLTWARDPRWNVTTFGYDARNRKTSMSDPIPSDRNSNGHTVDWVYDGVGNKRYETRADNATREWRYDSVNRLTDTFGFGGERTQYTRQLPNDLTEWITDAKGAVYTFTYDALHRKTTETYPPDATGRGRSEHFWYDAAGNLIAYKNPADDYKRFSYDNRNRERDSWWDWGGPSIHKDFDTASRLTNVTTNGSETLVAFGYDAANRKIWEEQTLSGYPTRRVETPVDADGNRSGLWVYTNGQANFGVYYDYTQRNQLAHIYDGGWTPWFNYTYDAAGNMTRRQDVYWGVNDSENIPTQSYDALNRPVEWENTGAGDTVFARSWYQYDKLSREVATWRDEQAGKGDFFNYTVRNQLNTAVYDADQVSTGNPGNWLNRRDYGYTADGLNRAGVNLNGPVEGYQTNALNQYTNVGGLGLGYDNNFNLADYNGFHGDYDAQNRLMSASKDGTTVYFTYDGLGRCVRRVVGGVTTLFTYDDWKPVFEWDGNGNKTAWNVYGPGADEILWRFQVQVGHTRYHHDARGNVTFVLLANGQGYERYTYDAFGKPKIMDWNGNERSQTAIENSFMFQGRDWIPELGIYDYRHRMYHPALGRFLQTDPTGFDAGDTNLFRYCGDDPVDGSDPTGLFLVLTGDRKFQDAVYNQMQELWKNGGQVWRDAITELANSNNYHVFEPATYNQTNRRFTGELGDHAKVGIGKGGVERGGRADSRANNFVNNMRDALKQSKGETIQLFNIPQKSGSTIRYDPGKIQTKFGPRPSWIGLSHEMAHALDMDHGTYPDSPSGKVLREQRAIWWENQARSSIGWDLRGWNQIE